MKDTTKLIKALRAAAPDGHRCLGCEYANGCSIHGCQMMKLAADHLDLMRQQLTTGGTTAQNQAIFRLGQMDMKESVIAMLQKPAEFTSGVTRAALLSAVDLIKDLEVP